MMNMLDDVFSNLLEFLRAISWGMIDRAKLAVRHCEIADKDHAESDRVYAHVGCATGMICIAEAMAQDFSDGKLDTGNIRGIFLHEIGHILHDKYHEHLNDLDSLPDTNDPEVCADATIHALFRVIIRYDSRKVQWVDLGDF